jgi:hypothetical protein
MTPSTDGRHCSRCQHTVADLTTASDAELMVVLTGDNAPHCARFHPAQLDRVLRPERSRSGLLPIAAFTSLLALACGTETIAQGGSTMGEMVMRPAPVQVDTPRTGQPVIVLPADTTGTVLATDSTSTPLPPPPPMVMGKFMVPPRHVQEPKPSGK